MSSASHALLASSVLISQGAEAKLYKAKLTLSAPPILVKHRFQKQYRHPTLDASLTRARVAGEARALLKCLRSGVNVPGIRMVDAAEGVLGIEWVEGMSIRHLLPGGAEGYEEPPMQAPDNEDDTEPQGKDDVLSQYETSPEILMSLIGTEIAKMHSADIIHGDLTTSNIMLRRPSHAPDTPTEIVLIDFGLSFHSNLVEDQAVDLYVLERAFASTHPDTESLFVLILTAYGKKIGKKWPAIGKRLDEVRLRGRKRSMVG